MDYTKIQDIGFTHIAKSLKNKKELTELVLSFIEADITTNKGLKILGKNLQKLGNLKFFSLNLMKTGIS